MFEKLLGKSAFKLAREGKTEEVMRAVERDPSLLEQFDRKVRSSLLMIAIVHSNRELVQALLSAGANPKFGGDASQGNDASPLHLCTDHPYINLPAYRSPAMEQTLIDIAALLLKAGANPNAVSNWQGGHTPLQRAIKHDWPAMVRLLLNHGAQVFLPGADPRSAKLDQTYYAMVWDRPSSNEVRKLLEQWLRNHDKSPKS